MFKSYNIRFLALSICICFAAISTAFGQGFIETIEPLPGDIRSDVQGVSPDGRHVVARSWSNSGIIRSFLWTEGQVVTIFGNLPGSNSGVNAVDASMNGSYVVGSGINAAGEEEAFRWRASDNSLTGLGTLVSGTLSRGNSISDDGQALAGWANHTFPFTEGWH